MTTVRVRTLGVVAVEHDGVLAPAGSVALRTLLALFALRPGEPIAGETLIAQLWPGSEIPQHPSATLYTRITRLRGWLGAPELVRAGAGAYTLRLRPEHVDLSSFLAASDEVLRPSTSDEAVLDECDAALAIWRGDPFPGLDAPHLGPAREHARERRLRVVDRRVRALLGLGRATEAVDAVAPLAAEHPGRESLHALHVEALHRAGRPREAVEAYLAVRRHLADELAVAPGPELRAAYQRIVEERSASGTIYTRRPTLVGRDAALQSITGALSAEGRLVVVDGVAGIGKSLLLAAARHRADVAGAQVVAGAWQEDRTPLAAWREALGRPPTSTPGREPGPWLLDRLGLLARDGPVLLTLDDAHRADSASLGVLTMLARTGVPAGVVVAVAARAPDTVEHPAWSAAFVELSRGEQTVCLALDVLDAEAVVSMATTRLAPFGPEAADELAAEVAARSGGHPLHAAALLDVLAAQPDAACARAAAGQVPARLRPMLEHQVAQLDHTTRATLEVLAVLSPIDLSGLAAVLDRRALEVADDLRPAVDAGLAVALADRVVLRHDLTADAVRDAVPAVNRTHLHHTRLRQLDDAADPFERLRHTLGAAAVVPATELAAARLDAGIAAYARRALSEARGLLDDAAVAPEPASRASVYRGLVLGALGDLAAADDVLDTALEALLQSGSTDDDTARLLVLAAVGDDPLGTSVAGDPRRLARLRRAEGRGDLPPESRFELLASVVREEALGGTPRSDALAEMRTLAGTGGLAATTRARASALEARALQERPVLARTCLAAAQQAWTLADRCEDPLLRLDATELLMTGALAAGRVDRARALRAVMAEEAERWHRPRLIWAGHLVEAALMLAEGDVAAADQAAMAGLHRGQELGIPDALQGYGAHLVVRHVLAGTAHELVEVTAGAAAAAPTIPAWSAGAAVAASCAGALDSAAAHLAEFRRRRAAVGEGDFDRPALCMAALAAFCLGDADVARLVSDALPHDPDAVVLVGFGAAVVGPATVFTGLAAWTLGDLPTARDAFAAAHTSATALGWTPWSRAASRLEGAVDAEHDLRLPLGLTRSPDRW